MWLQGLAARLSLQEHLRRSEEEAAKLQGAVEAKDSDIRVIMEGYALSCPKARVRAPPAGSNP